MTLDHPISYRTASRLVAAGIAATAWTGLILQCVATGSLTSSLLETLWIISAYFTILTNLLVAAVFTAIAANRTAFRGAWVIAGTMLSILLVGIIYGLLLHGTVELSGGSAIANVLLHMVTPILVPLFWIAFVPKGSLTWRHPLLWATYPLAYLVYGLSRGAATGKYAYPFINVPALGWPRTALNAALIAIAFMLSGYLVVWIDNRLATRSTAPFPHTS